MNASTAIKLERLEAVARRAYRAARFEAGLPGDRKTAPIIRGLAIEREEALVWVPD